MNQTVRILIVADDPSDAELMVRELKRDGLQPGMGEGEDESGVSGATGARAGGDSVGLAAADVRRASKLWIC